LYGLVKVVDNRVVVEILDRNDLVKGHLASDRYVYVTTSLLSDMHVIIARI
jgi:hypothetical protein